MIETRLIEQEAAVVGEKRRVSNSLKGCCRVSISTARRFQAEPRSADRLCSIRLQTRTSGRQARVTNHQQSGRVAVTLRGVWQSQHLLSHSAVCVPARPSHCQNE